MSAGWNVNGGKHDQYVHVLRNGPGSMSFVTARLLLSVLLLTNAIGFKFLFVTLDISYRSYDTSYYDRSHGRYSSSCYNSSSNSNHDYRNDTSYSNSTTSYSTSHDYDSLHHGSYDSNAKIKLPEAQLFIISHKCLRIVSLFIPQTHQKTILHFGYLSSRLLFIIFLLIDLPFLSDNQISFLAETEGIVYQEQFCSNQIAKRSATMGFGDVGIKRFVSFVIVWRLFLWINRFLDPLKVETDDNSDELNNDITVVTNLHAVILIVCVMFKRILKFIGRNIDNLTIKSVCFDKKLLKRNLNNYRYYQYKYTMKFLQFLSCEWLVEIIIIMYYHTFVHIIVLNTTFMIKQNIIIVIISE